MPRTRAPKDAVAAATARLAIDTRWGRPQETLDADRRALTIAKAERAIDEVHRADPPLTGEQLARLVDRLRGKA